MAKLLELVLNMVHVSHLQHLRIRNMVKVGKSLRRTQLKLKKDFCSQLGHMGAIEATLINMSED